MRETCYARLRSRMCIWVWTLSITEIINNVADCGLHGGTAETKSRGAWI